MKEDKFEWYILFGIIIGFAFMLFTENFDERDKGIYSYATITIPNHRPFVEDEDDPFTVKLIDNIDIRDTVYYQDLDINKQYIVKGWVEDEKTKETLGSSEFIFCPDTAKGSINIVVNLKNVYAGKTIKFWTSIEEKK